MSQGIESDSVSYTTTPNSPSLAKTTKKIKNNMEKLKKEFDRKVINSQINSPKFSKFYQNKRGSDKGWLMKDF